jgi:mxaJ protein
MAMGVRYGEREWKQKIETLLETQRPAIDAILRDFGVPLVDEAGNARAN